MTVLGLAFGSGEFGLGFIGVGLALITLYVLPQFEKLIPSDWYGTLSVTFVPSGFTTVWADDFNGAVYRVSYGTARIAGH